MVGSPKQFWFLFNVYLLLECSKLSIAFRNASRGRCVQCIDPTGSPPNARAISSSFIHNASFMVFPFIISMKTSVVDTAPGQPKTLNLACFILPFSHCIFISTTSEHPGSPAFPNPLNVLRSPAFFGFLNLFNTSFVNN